MKPHQVGLLVLMIVTCLVSMVGMVANTEYECRQLEKSRYKVRQEETVKKVCRDMWPLKGRHYKDCLRRGQVKP